eukprot:TRINITY_DN10381_c0_g1_i1.p1 TRINITY_DN10381_c0_g1~~TRINITY_DN10381_c0_g1_i1.p1  ORF type:complete len:486 (-),score=96.43 TRINITY_DN10381_c0_g1_i1:142-1455(-)
MDYSRFINKVASKRIPGLHSLANLLRVPGMISISGGLPNPAAFPFKEFSFKIEGDVTLTLSSENLNNSLQYSETAGIPGLLKWLGDYTLKMHNPPRGMSQTDICTTSGSNDAICKCFEAFLTEGDSLLMESPTYATAVSAAVPLGVHRIGIQIDSEGIIPSSLESLLSNWSSVHPLVPFPKVLYTIPTGQNPSGASQTLERKQAVYKLAQRFNFIIIEDDPYWLLQYPEYQSSKTASSEGPHHFIHPTPSYLSLDVDGRVIRLDSFSKILASGLRVGWVTGPKELIHPIHLHHMVSAAQISGLSQTVFLTLLEHWGHEKFFSHIESVQRLYWERRDIAVDLAYKYLGKYVSFSPPAAGMFLWMKINNCKDSKEFVDKARKNLVSIIPGSMFIPEGNDFPSPFVRISFSLAKKVDMEEAFQRLGKLLAEGENGTNGST